MNTELQKSRLQTLSREIHQLEAALVEAQRTACDMLGDEQECHRALERAAAAKCELDRALKEYFMISHWVLFSRHGARAA